MPDEKVAGETTQRREEREQKGGSQQQQAQQPDVKAEVRAELERVRAEREKAEAERKAQEAREAEEAERLKTDPKAVLDEQVGGLKALREELAQEREELRKEREATQSYRQREIQRSRLKALRDMGASPSIPDEDLLKLAPDVDPDTADGRAKLDAWRDARPGMFEQQEPAPRVDLDKLGDELAVKGSGFFGADFVRRTMGGK